MFKVLMPLTLFVSVGLAGDLVVKKSDVVISLNGEKIALKKGDAISLSDGDLVCFKEGEGRVIINKRRQMNKKSKKCYQTPLPKGFDIASYMEQAKSKIALATIGHDEEVIHGVSTRGVVNLDDGKDIIIKKNDENLVMYSKEFGPHPVIMYLKDTNGNELLSFENEENDITFFQLKTTSLKTGYSIEILNGFDEVLVSKKIVIK